MKEQQELADVRHLLRNLGNPSELRCNSIVEFLFARTGGSPLDTLSDSEVLSQVRTLIAWALRCIMREGVGLPREVSRNKRRYEIIARCDLFGKKHEAVAAELGLSTRQFYRERNDACVALESILRHESPPNRVMRIAKAEGFSLRLWVSARTLPEQCSRQSGF